LPKLRPTNMKFEFKASPISKFVVSMDSLDYSE
jgi:hypothetical protein